MALVTEGLVLVNDKPCFINQTLFRNDTIKYNGEIIYQPPSYLYLALNKPRGIECTYNRTIPNNLLTFLPVEFQAAFPVGRLDKDSEGLLFLTTDGYFSDKIFRADWHFEKEYQVTTKENITDEQLDLLANGIVILGQLTRKCKVSRIAKNSFSIILSQGINRQIRRMCYKIGHEVIRLKRIRIGSFNLPDEAPIGSIIELPTNTVSELLGGIWPTLKA